MSDGPGTAREAAERNAEAVASGNLNQVLMDLTPDALGQMMQLGGAGGANPAALPNVESYEIEAAGVEGDTESFRVTFRSAEGAATLEAAWKLVLNQWKIVSVKLVSAEAEGS